MLNCSTCIASPRSSGYTSNSAPTAGHHLARKASDQQLTSTNRDYVHEDFQYSQHLSPTRRQQDTAIEYHADVKISKRWGGFDLETRKIQSFGIIVPTQVAARYLIDFFETIALRIETGVWADSAPTNYRIIHMWDFELSFYSMHANIPWDFIQQYVIDVVADIEKGFTGVYYEHLSGVINGIAAVITVGMRLVRYEPPMVLTRRIQCRRRSPPN
ncbi:MAG: hypothetical protein Q9171_005038 [Xanthocarpia ochracea]